MSSELTVDLLSLRNSLEKEGLIGKESLIEIALSKVAVEALAGMYSGLDRGYPFGYKFVAND